MTYNIAVTFIFLLFDFGFCAAVTAAILYTKAQDEIEREDESFIRVTLIDGKKIDTPAENSFISQLDTAEIAREGFSDYSTNTKYPASYIKSVQLCCDKNYYSKHKEVLDKHTKRFWPVFGIVQIVTIIAIIFMAIKS